jgi:A/G-specific adenine glycosylase
VTAEPGQIAPLLLAWYDRERRELPWRYAPGVAADAYRVWLSEIMLQQTTVKAVVPYFKNFTQRWPTVQALAAASRDDVLAAWAGLGYYARARNLHACAAVVANQHDGKFPTSEAELLALPGVGAYTAAAVASIGHGLKATPVDGNIERVVARLFAIEAELPVAKPALRKRAETLTPDLRAGDFAQAMMDLGATVCTPKSPSCLLCPLVDHCRARFKGIAAELPRKAAKPERPTRYGVAFVVQRSDGTVLLRTRPPKGLLGGMLEVPSTDWVAIMPGGNTVAAARPVSSIFTMVDERVVHVFTHFRLELVVHMATVPKSTKLAPAAQPELCRWQPLTTLSDAALPSLMIKVLRTAGISMKR